MAKKDNTAENKKTNAIREISVKDPNVKEIKKEKPSEEESKKDNNEEGEGDEDFDSEEPGDVSDFSISDTLLSKNPVHSWEGKNLEDSIEQEQVEKDWGNSDDSVAGDFYKPSGSSGDLYGTASGSGDLYNSSSSGDLYDSESGSGEPYGVGDSSSLSNSTYNTVDEQPKPISELRSERQSGRSMLEISGFKDKEKDKERKRHHFDMLHDA